MLETLIDSREVEDFLGINPSEQALRVSEVGRSKVDKTLKESQDCENWSSAITGLVMASRSRSSKV